MLTLALAILIAAAVAPGEAEVQLLDGTTVAGTITAFDAQGVKIVTAAGPRDLARASLLDIRWTREPAADDPAAPATQYLELIDGARLPVTEFTAAKRVATISTPLADRPLRIPAERIRRVDLQPPTNAAADVWRQLDGSEAAGDVLLVANREGTKLDYLTGVIGDVTAEEVAFEYDNQKLPVKRTRVAGLAYYHAEAARLPEALCELTLVGGATLPVRQLELADGSLRVITPAAVRLTIPLGQVERADFSAGKLAYLSDLEPTAVDWTPRVAAPAAATLIAHYGDPRNDVSYAGSALTLAWADESAPSGRDVRTFAKGLALRSRTEATWRLPAGMRRFTATAGIDPATAEEGHVLLEIRADERILWEGEIDGRRDPVAIDVDLGTARRLQIRVDYGRNLDFGDRLHLVDARVTK
jgi:hypothetical protein